jgi:Bacterial Ig-like domain
MKRLLAMMFTVGSMNFLNSTRTTDLKQSRGESMKINFRPLLFVALVSGLIACGGGSTTNALTVSISSPSVDAFTKGALSIQVVVTGAPDTVDLLKDGTVLATLAAPYSYSWDTSAEPERAYSLTARAKKAGAADVISAAKQVTVDRTVPSLVSRVPINNAVNVFLADEISATFSEPMLASSVTANSAQLKIGTNVLATTAALDTAGTKLVLKPTLLPALTATITVALNGLTDRAGNTLTVPNSSFNAPDWQAPGGVQALNSVVSDAPKIAMDSSGNPVVAWAEAGKINVKKWNGTSWTLLAVTNGGVSSMALDSNNNPIVTGSEITGSAFHVYVKRWNGASWDQLGSTYLDANTNFNPPNSSIAIDSTDSPIVSWNENDGTSSKVYVKRWNGSAWIPFGSTPLNIDSTKNARNPSIALNSSGFPVVTWEESDGTHFNIYVKRWNGTSWVQFGSSSLNIDPTKDAQNPSIALDSSGNPIISWDEFGAGFAVSTFNVYVKRWNGTSWVQIGPTFLDVNTDQAATKSSVKVNSSGNPIVSWNEDDGASYNVYVKSWNGSSWVQVGSTSLDANTSQNAVNPSLAIDSNGTPTVAWLENNFDFIYVKRFNRIP